MAARHPCRTSPRLAALALAGALLAGAALAEDPLKSPACGAALAQLQAAREQGRGGVEPLRQAAAQACLGPGAAAGGRTARVLRPPDVVPPPVLTPPAMASVPPPVLVQPAAPVAIPRAAMPRHCDAAGCWADDGTHLRHVGPPPTVPGGPCALRGGVVYCP